MTPRSDAAIAAHLSAARLAPYDARAGSRSIALDLYEWNNALASSIYASSALLEVALRNALDRQLTTRHAQRRHSGDWLSANNSDLTANYQQPEITGAGARAVRAGKPRSHGQLVSYLPFGFWTSLINRSQNYLWTGRAGLANAFPHAPNRDIATLNTPLRKIHLTRNRIAHHEPIWNKDPDKLNAEVLKVAQYLDPALADWIEGISRFGVLMRAIPPLP